MTFTLLQGTKEELSDIFEPKNTNTLLDFMLWERRFGKKNIILTFVDTTTVLNTVDKFIAVFRNI
jgi:hypothetical protein